MIWEGYSKIRQLEKLGDGVGVGVGVGGWFLLDIRIGRANQLELIKRSELRSRSVKS